MREVSADIGGHGEEKLAKAFIASLEIDPISSNVHPGDVSPLASRLGVRQIWKDEHTENIVQAAPGDPYSIWYEKWRVAQAIANRQGYDAAAFIHSLNHYGEDAGHIDAQRGASAITLGFLGMLDIRILVATEYGGLQRYVPNGFVLELSATGVGGDFPRLRRAFDVLANSPNPPTAKAADFKWFKYIDGMHVKHGEPKAIMAALGKDYVAFDPIPKPIAARLGHVGVSIALSSWRLEPNELGYWGEMVLRIPTPDESLWRPGDPHPLPYALDEIASPSGLQQGLAYGTLLR